MSTGCIIAEKVGLYYLTFPRTVHVSDGERRIATVDYKTVENGVVITSFTDVVRYQYDNHLGSACLELDANALTITYEEYHPFGTSSYKLADNDTEVKRKRYRYVGKERDEETGLYYYGARYYAAWIGRWTAVDPKAKESQNKTPYHYCSNNPINRIDPDGKTDDNYTIFENGHIQKEVTKDSTNTYIYKNNNGKETNLGTYPVSKNAKKDEMVKAGEGENGSNEMYKWVGIRTGNLYFEEDAFAAFLGATKHFYDNNSSVEKIQINQFSSIDRFHSINKPYNAAIDVAYYSNTGQTGTHTDWSSFSDKLNTSLYNSFKNFGLGSEKVFTSKSKESKEKYFSFTDGWPGHHHHFHFQGFDKSKVSFLSKKAEPWLEFLNKINMPTQIREMLKPLKIQNQDFIINYLKPKN